MEPGSDPHHRQGGPDGNHIDVFDFELSAGEMAAIDGLETGCRGGAEPEAVTLETFGRQIPEA